MPRTFQTQRFAAACMALVCALALAATFSPDTAKHAHADVKPTGTIQGVSQLSSNPTYDRKPQRGYEGTPICKYTDGSGVEQTYTGPFIATYTGTVHESTPNDHPYGPTTEAPTQAGSYQVELSLPDSAPCTAAPSARSFTIERAPLSATVSPSDENATRPYDYSETPTFTDIKLTAFTGLVPADEGQVDITTTGDALDAGGHVPDGNVATKNGTPTGKPFKATSVSYNNPTSYNYDLQTSHGTYNVSGEVMIVKMPMPDINEATKHEVWNEYGASYSMPVYSIPKGSTSATYTIITDMTETQGLYKAEIENINNEAYLKVYANGKGDDAYDAVTVRMSALENHGDFNVTLHVQYFRETVKAIEGVTPLPSPVEYDGQPHAGFEGTPTAYYLYNGKHVDYGTLPGETFDTTYTGTAADGTRYDSTTPPTNAGTYQVTIAISPGHVCMGSTAFDFTIDKPTLTFRALNASMTAGNPPPSLEYTVEGLVGSDRVIQEPRLSIVGDTTAAGSCTIAIAGATVDNQACYQVVYEPGTLAVAAGPEKSKPEPSAKLQPKTALPATGDSGLLDLLVCTAGAAVFAIGLAAGRRRRTKRD